MAPEPKTSVVTLVIKDGSLDTVIIDGAPACEVDDETRENIFAPGNGPIYVGTVLYSVDPTTKMARICVHKRCRLVCG
jgi:hypothetical protein